MLDALKILQKLNALDIYPSQYGDKLRVSDPNKRLTNELRSQIRANKSAIIERLAGKQTRDIEEVYGLTPMQSGMLFESLLTPNSGTYIEPSLFYVEDTTFDVTRFIQAIEHVIDQHDSLRAAFQSHHEGETVQVVYQCAQLPVAVLDWRDLSEDDYQTHLANHIKKNYFTDFDFSQAPLLRLTVIERTQNTYHMLFTSHHILLDRWSVDLFWSAVRRVYAEQPLPQNIPYQSYIHYLRQRPVEPDFWKTYLRGFSVPTPLPTIARQGITQTEDKLGFITQSFSLDSTHQINAFVRTQGITLNTLFQATWGLLLARYTNETDVVFGIVTSGRNAPVKGIESIIGLFINTLPFRVQLDSGENDTGEKNIEGKGTKLTGLTLLQQVVQTHLDIQQHEHTPLLDIQRWSEVSAGTRLFDSLYLFQNTPKNTIGTDASRLNLQRVWTETGDTGYPLVALVAPGNPDQPVRITLKYHTTQYAAKTIERILTHWQSLVMSMVSYSDKPALQLPMLTEAEYHQIVHEWNNTAVDFGEPETIHALFEQQVERTPNATALVFENKQLTYKELNERANQLAHYLIKLGVQADTLIGVAMERSLEMVMSFLAILKAGGAYVPIDPTYPSERIHLMLMDTKAKIVLTKSPFNLSLKDHVVPRLVHIDQDNEAISSQSTENPRHMTNAKNLAYVLYTSGSTGNAKGVLIEHRHLFNYIKAIIARFNIKPDASFALAQSLQFDLGLTMVYPALATGGTLHILNDDEAKDPAFFSRYLQQHTIEYLKMTPSHLSALMNESHIDIQTAIILGGEAADTKW
ncbi:MAG: condensation domain-containing protein, partial [Chloroflexota bacterium]